MISWIMPSPGARRKFGGLAAHLLWIEELSPGCPPCSPLSTAAYEFAAEDPLLQVESDTAFRVFRPARRESGWRARAAFRFGDGAGRATAPVSMPGLGAIPRPAMGWEWSVQPADTPPESTPEVRLRWTPAQERIVFIVERGTPPSERALPYRANLYARVPGEAWPRVPLNAAPLEADLWQGRPSRAALQRGQGVLQFAMRWVNSLGGEGPLSDPVDIAFVPEPSR